MGDVAASTLARLKNKAAQTGRSNQLCLQLFCQEEFLRRLQYSPYAKNFILKGGLFIYALTDFDSRVTVDVDFLLKKIPNTPEELQSVLREIIAIDTGNNFVTFEITKTESISVAKKYAGVRAFVVAKIKNTRTLFTIDFGVGDVITPKHVKRKMPIQLDGFEAPVINTYSIETTIAEKLDAILALMEFSSRMKDYYDIMYLSRKFDFDGNILCTAISKTFANRSRDFTIEQFDNIIALSSDVAMNKKWVAFLKKINAANTDFAETLKAIDNFAREVLAAVFEKRGFLKNWSALRGRWL